MKCCFFLVIVALLTFTVSVQSFFSLFCRQQCGLFFFPKKSMWHAGVKQLWSFRDLSSFIHTLSPAVSIQPPKFLLELLAVCLTSALSSLLQPSYLSAERKGCLSAASGKEFSSAQNRVYKEQRLPMWIACTGLEAYSRGDSRWLHPNLSCLVFLKAWKLGVKQLSEQMSKKTNGFTEAGSAAASSSWATPASTFI